MNTNSTIERPFHHPNDPRLPLFLRNDIYDAALNAYQALRKQVLLCFEHNKITEDQTNQYLRRLDKVLEDIQLSCLFRYELSEFAEDMRNIRQFSPCKAFALNLQRQINQFEYELQIRG